MRIVMIGTGNTATVLGRLMKARGHDLLQVYGRSGMASSELAKTLAASPITSLQAIATDADLYVIAISDDAIAGVSSQLSVENRLIVHTAGAVSIEALASASRNYGVLYPYQSLRKEMGEELVIPFLVDGNTNEDLTLLEDFARTLSPQVAKANDQQRMGYHLAAVVTNNFSNHLYTLVYDFCVERGLSFSLLQPMVAQLSQRLATYPPSRLQTGPAIRGDRSTINSHLQLLEGNNDLKAVYEIFTRAIASYYAANS